MSSGKSRESWSDRRVAAGLKDGKLLAALRSSKVDMHFAVSEDSGKTWGSVRPFGFKGHHLRHDQSYSGRRSLRRDACPRQ